MSIEAMKQALEALEKLSMGGDPRWADDVMPSLRQAIEQAEKQEPVADLVECGNCHEGLSDMDHVCKKCLGAGWVRNLDTTPQPNVPTNDTKQERVAKPQEKRHEWVEVECPLCGEMAVAHTHPALNKEKNT